MECIGSLVPKSPGGRALFFTGAVATAVGVAAAVICVAVGIALSPVGPLALALIIGGAAGLVAGTTGSIMAVGAVLYHRSKNKKGGPPIAKIESYGQLNVVVDRVLPANMDEKTPHRQEKMWLREIFLATYPTDNHFFFYTDEKFLRSVCKLVDQGKLLEALMMTVFVPGGKYPNIYPALCMESWRKDNSDISCSKYAYDLLLKLKEKDRKYFFEKCTYNRGRKESNIKNDIISVFAPHSLMRALANCTNCIDFLMKIPKEECEELLMAKNWRQQTIVDHMKEMQKMVLGNPLDRSIIKPCNEIIKAYEKLVTGQKLDVKYQL
jgi:hypothetical protein